MGRRRNESLMDALVMLPWWVGVCVGLIGFAVIRWGIAEWLSRTGGPLGKATAAQMSNGALSPFAWFFLLLCCISALFSWIRTRDRARLLDRQSSLESIRSMPWQAFERLVGEAYRRQGYRMTETGQGGADGGVDLLLQREGRTTLVQCKHWRSQKVGVATVREMYGLMVHHRADAVKIVCTGNFSDECFAFSRGKPIELVDGEALLRLVQGVQVRAAGAASSPVAEAATNAFNARVPEAIPASDNPSCPRCGSRMARRTNRTTGAAFWGCLQYPKCKGTAEVSP
jgi:restriction system protein